MKCMRKHHVVAVLLTICLSVAAAYAGKIPVDISAEANNSWCGQRLINNCSTFPTGKHSYDGVTFNIPTTHNAWFADTAAGQGSGSVSVTIPVNVLNVKTVYVLMNTIWGSTQSGFLSITFTGTNGATFTYQPIGGQDVRDYNNGSFTNTIDCAIPGGAGKAGTVSAFNNSQG